MLHKGPGDLGKWSNRSGVKLHKERREKLSLMVGNVVL